jgi:hypothetical protein
MKAVGVAADRFLRERFALRIWVEASRMVDASGRSQPQNHTGTVARRTGIAAASRPTGIINPTPAFLRATLQRIRGKTRPIELRAGINTTLPKNPSR